MFVSCDRGAHWLAKREGVPVTDVLGLGVACVELGLLAKEALARRLSPWDSPHAQMGKPHDYAGFDSAFEQRVREVRLLFELSQTVGETRS